MQVIIIKKIIGPKRYFFNIKKISDIALCNKIIANPDSEC